MPFTHHLHPLDHLRHLPHHYQYHGLRNLTTSLDSLHRRLDYYFLFSEYLNFKPVALMLFDLSNLLVSVTLQLGCYQLTLHFFSFLPALLVSSLTSCHYNLCRGLLHPLWCIMNYYSPILIIL